MIVIKVIADPASFKNDTTPLTLSIEIAEISSKPTINVLGITFDAKL